MLKDYEHISNPHQQYSLACEENIMSVAIKTGNAEIVKLILNYQTQVKEDKINRVKLPNINLEKMTTGVANRYQFYFPMRKVQLSRGGKEGNNAFTHDSKLRYVKIGSIKRFFKYEPTVSIYKLFQAKGKGGDEDEDDDEEENGNSLSYRDLKEVIGKVARTGNFDLFRYLMKGVEKNHGYGFNKLHTSSVLQGKEVETIKNVAKTSLLKKAFDVFTLMPSHMAAINPDPSVLKKYFKAYPTIMQQDAQQRDIVHYAAANKNSDALEFLISKNADINNRDMKGVTPLMIACKLGRAANVH